GQPTLLLLPTWAIVDSRHWKMQVPFLARNYRVITFDPRGNGRSDRPADPAAYADAAFASDIGAVLDATGTERAVLGAFCSGFPWALLFAAAHGPGYRKIPRGGAGRAAARIAPLLAGQ